MTPRRVARTGSGGGVAFKSSMVAPTSRSAGMVHAGGVRLGAIRYSVGGGKGPCEGGCNRKGRDALLSCAFLLRRQRQSGAVCGPGGGTAKQLARLEGVVGLL